jgi:hypothetical protein
MSAHGAVTANAIEYHCYNLEQVTLSSKRTTCFVAIEYADQHHMYMYCDMQPHDTGFTCVRHAACNLHCTLNSNDTLVTRTLAYAHAHTTIVEHATSQIVVV